MVLAIYFFSDFTSCLIRMWNLFVKVSVCSKSRHNIGSSLENEENHSATYLLNRIIITSIQFRSRF